MLNSIAVYVFQMNFCNNGYWCIYIGLPTVTIWFDVRESVVMPFRALLEQVFNQGSLISHFRCTGYMTASRTKDENLLRERKIVSVRGSTSKPAPIDIKHLRLDSERV